MRFNPNHTHKTVERAQRRSARSTALTALMAVAFGLSLAACQPKPETPAGTPEPTVGQKIDNAMAQAGQTAAEVKQDIKEATSGARTDMGQAADTASNAVRDAGITAAVNAKLAADPALSALRINVDTSAGRVALSGDAPDTQARDRATVIAKSVDGVLDVENKLTIEKKG